MKKPKSRQPAQVTKVFTMADQGLPADHPLGYWDTFDVIELRKLLIPHAVEACNREGLRVISPHFPSEMMIVCLCEAA